MKNYAIYSIAMTVRIVFTFGILTVVYDWYFPTLIIVILAVLNDGTVMTISKDRVTPNDEPDSWKLREVFITAIVLGLWLTVSTIVLFELANKTDFFVDKFSLDDFRSNSPPVNHLSVSACDNFENYKDNTDARKDSGCGVNSDEKCCETFYQNDADKAKMCNCGIWQERDENLRGLIYIQVSVTGQGTIFVTRAKSFFFLDRPAIIVIMAFVVAQTVATIIGVYGFDGYPDSRSGFGGCGWGYAAVAWVWSVIWFIPLDFMKFFVRFCLSNKLSSTYNRTTFTTHINAGHVSGRSTNVSQKMSARRGSQRVIAKRMSHV
eukprot:Nk52_evm44s224 gene=Nk52_evmTU44s224